MGILLTAYCATAFSEFYLPPIKDDDYVVVLDDKLFGLSQPLSIRLEASGAKWLIHNQVGITAKINHSDFTVHELKHGDILRLNHTDENVQVAVIVTETSGSVRPFNKYALSGQREITIGSASSCAIQYQYFNLITSCHASLRNENGSWYLLDNNSKNGVFVGNRRISGKYLLNFCDIINVFGLKIVFLADCIAIDESGGDIHIFTSSLQPYTVSNSITSIAAEDKPAERYFKRSPRFLGKLYDEPFEIEAPPAPQKQRKQPLLLTIGPAFTMIIPMLLGTTISLVSSPGGGGNITGLFVSGAAGLIAVMWALIRLKNSKKTSEEDEKLRASQYQAYLQKNEAALGKQNAYNAETLRSRYPSAAVCCTYSKNRLLLWNRNSSHSDLLFVRLGLGRDSFQSPIIIPKERFSLINDALADYPRILKEKYEWLYNVPVGLDLLDKRLVGVLAMSNRASAINIMRCIAIQLAANDCYTDIKMVFLYNEKEASEWQFARWLQHVWDNGKRVRYIATNKTEAGDMLYSLSSILRDRAEAVDNAISQRNSFAPHYVVFVADTSLIEGEGISKYLLNSQQSIGVSVIYLCDSYDELPNNCTDIVQCNEQFAGIYNVSMMESEKISVQFDSVSAEDADSFSREISGLQVSDTAASGEIPNSLTFFDMLGIRTLNDFGMIDKWRKHKPYETMRALIGQRGGGQAVYLDIHEKYHGPHGLVAGTTGSGKSETLQTYMLSLALNYSPEDIGFFVIDYKGGGMANLFKGLPHMLGTITNLSGNQVHRAMVSIKGEIKRRQRTFSEYDVNHIDKYMRLYKNKEATLPIPHLLIIIDEFAELKREEPDFMRELISVAQVGRSLGIHLILATQKPAGVVDDNIWSNSKFRLCLRVQDKQDSNDMLKRPDAAFITQAGRGYMQVGNDEIFELFQSGWSGAPYIESIEDLHTDAAFMLTTTGSSISGKRRNRELKEQNKLRWISQLVSIIRESTSCSGNSNNGNISAVNSIYDRLEQQEIELPRSSSNDARLQQLATIVQDLLFEFGDKIADETVAARAIRLANDKRIKLPEYKEKTQLDATVEYISRMAEANGIYNETKLWLPVLPKYIPLAMLSGFANQSFDGTKWQKHGTEWSLSAIIGLCDDPVNQSQFPISVDFSLNGHLSVCGMVVSGKSTFMQTLLFSLCEKYSPDALNLYIVDYSNKMLMVFEDAPQVGAVITEEESDKLEKFFAMMDKELSRRKALFSGGNYSQYIRTNGVSEPAIVIALDGYANFREKTENMYESRLIAISREGANYGMYIAITAGGFGASEIQSRIGDNIKTVIALEMGDKFKYADVLRTTSLNVLPDAGIKGRGLIRCMDSFYEFQTAVALDAKDDYMRAELMRQEFLKMRNAWNGACAKPVPQIPSKPIWEMLAANPDYKENTASEALLTVGYKLKDASLYGINLKKVFTYIVAGKARGGKTNFLKAAAMSALDKKAAVHFIDTAEQKQKQFAEETGINYYSDHEGYVACFRAILTEMVERNKRKNELLKLKKDRDELTEIMLREYTPIFILIDNFADFIADIYRKERGETDISGFVENLVDKGENHNIYLLVGITSEDIGRIKGRRAADVALSRKTGVLLGSCAAEQRILDFPGMSHKDLSKTFRVGSGFASVIDEPTAMVLIPLVN